tara:strand:+ start:1202 stop:1351 length:150 start_codon:yes stop_codon:yes gene_type:complete
MYKNKYLKYKNKYLELKNKIGGSSGQTLPLPSEQEIPTLVNIRTICHNN